MPLTVNIGLSKKTSENYNSQGASINLSAELDQALLTKPDELQAKIQHLYREAERALELRGQSNRAARTPSNNHGNGNALKTSGGGGMTTSQRRAIDAIAQRLDINPVDEAQHEFGLDLDRMTIREASKLIDHLKATPGSSSRRRQGNGARS